MRCSQMITGKWIMTLQSLRIRLQTTFYVKVLIFKQKCDINLHDVFSIAAHQMNKPLASTV